MGLLVLANGDLARLDPDLHEHEKDCDAPPLQETSPTSGHDFTLILLTNKQPQKQTENALADTCPLIMSVNIIYLPHIYQQQSVYDNKDKLEQFSLASNSTW